MTENLIWETPPPSNKSGTDYAAIAASLKANPGKWAIIGEWTEDKRGSAGATAQGIRNGQFSGFRPAGSFEATQRGLKVYARYIGD